MRRDLPVPDHLLLPPAPTGDLAAPWRGLPSEQRHRLARLLDRGEVAPADHAMLAALAARRLATVWRLRTLSVGLAWLVLMTVWGYGRAATGMTVSGWLWAGVMAAAVAGAVHWRATSRRTDRWRALVAGTCDD